MPLRASALRGCCSSSVPYLYIRLPSSESNAVHPTQVAPLAVLRGGSVNRALPPHVIGKQNRGGCELQVVQQFFEQGIQFGQHFVYLKYS